MYAKYIIYSCLFIILCLIELHAYCNHIVKTYFNWKTLHNVWKTYINPRGMSYGLWDISNNTIDKANNNLYSFMTTKANINQQHTVLHLDCAIKKKNKNKNKKDNKKYDRIIAIETNSTSIPKLAHLLKEDGIIVCSTIVLNDDTPSSLYIDTICDFLCISKISYTEWNMQMEETFSLEQYDCTKNTLNPYYHYLFTSFTRKRQLPQWVADTLIYYFNSIPFKYVVCVCKTKHVCPS
jgi:hypothetical protein